MTDWNKLKVPELKAELKNRGLSQVGLKAALVARLTTADSESGFESEATAQDDPADPTLNSQSPTNNTAESAQTSEEYHSEEKLAATNDSQPAGSHQESTSERTAENISRNDLEFSQASAHENTALLSLPAVERKKIIEDKQKRKRRSQSPPESANDIARKRARQDDVLPLITHADPDIRVFQEEIINSIGHADWTERRKGVDTSMADTDIADAQPTRAGGSPDRPYNLAKEKVSIDHAASDETNNGNANNNNIIDGPDVSLLSSTPDGRLSTKAKDTRFRDLLPGRAASNQVSLSDRTVPSVNPGTAIDTESDRIVAPSIHPATSALYIRDFMRPLNATTLKEHLIDLATPPSATPNSEIIVNYYLDPIRTHSFISFTNVSAASRVRSELHNKIWPEERTRKPLWVDFIPLEKVQEWIADEQSLSGCSRSTGKKWEVAYDVDDEGNVTATLQEVGTSMPSARKSSIATAPTTVQHSGIEGAPSGPRAQLNSGPRITTSQPTLDQLFKSTMITPVLYYQPVSRELANRRLENIDKATSRNYSPQTAGTEINRFTFEDREILVDRGPEIFSGIRPPPGYRGRRGGVGVGGGVGERGAYRGRGDRYESSWRGGRDSRGRRY